MKKYFNDSTFTTTAAGLVSVLVGFTSSAIIVYQAAMTAGANAHEASSWLGVLCLSMGFLGVFLSIKTRVPVMFAWSTAGAALLINSVHGLSINEIIGSFVVSAFLITISGCTGLFEKLMNRIPISISSAMLAGVLLHFALDVFVAMKSQFLLTFVLFIVYILARRINPRLSIVFVLIAGVMLYWISGLLTFPVVDAAFLKPSFTFPAFTVRSIVGLAIPLFVVTMSSQNLTGVTVLRSFGYQIPISPLITSSGILNLITAPFGGFTLNLSALTAAICMGPESHPDPTKRYSAAVTSGLIYLVIGLFSGFVVTLFSAFPKELIMALAGIALFGTIGNSLTHAIEEEQNREASLITFFITASGVSLFGIGAAFWGLVGGSLCLLVKKISIK
jgi:benzoate membrane transport protein